MRASLPLEVLRSIRLSTWRDLFAACGAPPGLDVAACDLSSIRAALASSDLPDKLARAIFLILVFSTEAGRTDIYAAADALKRDSRWPEAISPSDLAATLIARSPTDPLVALILVAAKIIRDRAYRAWSSYFFSGSRDVSPVLTDSLARCAEALRKTFAVWAARHDFGEVRAVDVRLEESACVFEIVHEDRLTTDIVGPDFAPVTHRALRSHLVVYEPDWPCLLITTKIPEAVIPLAHSTGFALFGDGRHFLDEVAMDLWRLQEYGRAALVARGSARGVSLSAVGGNYESGEGDACTLRHGEDYFAALERYKIDIQGGRLSDTTFRTPLDGSRGGPKTSDVAMRPPHHLTVSEAEAGPVVRAHLRDVSLVAPKRRVLDFISLQPCVDGAPGWILLVKKEGFATLVAEGVLVADLSNRMVASPNHPHAGRIAKAYPLEGTRLLAVSRDPTIAPFVVEEKDLVVYRLDLGAFAAMIAREMGLKGPATGLDEDGVLSCGHRDDLGPRRVVVSLPTRAIGASTVKRLIAAAGKNGVAVLVMPEGRMGKSRLTEVAMPGIAGPWRPVVGAIAMALELEDVVPATVYAPVDARVVVHKKSGRVWVDGVLCEAVSEAGVRLLVILIERGGAVHTKEIAEYIAAGGKVTRDTTRRAVRAVAEAVKRTFGRRLPRGIGTMIEMPKLGYYRLGVKGFAA